MLAMRPPGATMSWHTSNVAGTPTASMATSTPAPPRERLDGAHRFVSGRAHRARGAERLRDLQAVLVRVDHHDLARRVELRGEEGGQADRPRADDGNRVAGLDRAVEDAALERRWGRCR